MKIPDFAGITDAAGLTADQRDTMARLLDVYEGVRPRNSKLRAYYDGNIKVREFGLTIDSSTLRNDQVCYWPEKAVTSLADRIRLDGFVFEDGGSDDSLAEVVAANNLVTAYQRYQPCKLIQGCMFAAVNATDRGAQIRFHSADTAAALPDGNHDSGIIGAGFVIARSGRLPGSPKKRMAPLQVNLYEPGRVTEIVRTDSKSWTAIRHDLDESQPLMVAFTHNSTGFKPFGQSRITKAVQSLTRDAVRALWRMELSSAFYSIPQRYIIGLSDEMYDALASDKTRQYLDSLFIATRDDDGAPTYGQLSGNTPQPFVDEIRALGCQFSGATGVPLSSLGIVTDNPISAEAIAASREDLIMTAERDIAADQASLKRLALLAMAVEGDTTVDQLTDTQKSVLARFRSPIMTSVGAMADSVMKIGSIAGDWFVQSDVFLEMLGFDAATVARVNSDRRRAQATTALAALASVPDAEDVEEDVPDTLLEA